MTINGFLNSLSVSICVKNHAVNSPEMKKKKKEEKKEVCGKPLYPSNFFLHLPLPASTTSWKGGEIPADLHNNNNNKNFKVKFCFTKFNLCIKKI